MGDSVLIVIQIPTADEQVHDFKEKDISMSPAMKRNFTGNQLKVTPTLQVSFVSLKDKLQDALNELQARDVTWQLTKNKIFWRVCFTCDMEETDHVLELLASKSIGSYRDTYVGIIPFSFVLKDEDTCGQLLGDDVFMDSSTTCFDGKNDTCHTNRGFALDSSDARNSSKRSGDLSSFQQKFLHSITSRLTVAQVASTVKSGADLTFDYIMNIIMASWIALMGLMENSIVSLVAAMLVSPLMNAVLAITFGQVVTNRSIRNLGIRVTGVSFLVSILFGYAFGLVSLNFLDQWLPPDGTFPTIEMRSRGELRNLWVGVLVGLPSGAALALSILSQFNNFLPAIGVAISASLLPPCVNAGVLWAHATLQLIRSLGEDKSVEFRVNDSIILIQPSRMHRQGYVPLYYPQDIVIECIVLGLVSICLSLVNIISLHIAGVLFLRIKEITPATALSPSTARFFKEDLKIARRYNQEKSKSHLSEECDGGDIGQQILQEWVDATGLNAQQIMFGDTAQAKAIQEQTLADIMEDVQNDQVFQVVRRGSVSINPVSQDFMSRFAPKTSPSTPFQGRRNTAFSARASPKGSCTSSLFDPSSVIDMSAASNRRKSTALRQTLLTTDHLPYSIWPKGQSSRFSVTPASLEVPSTSLGVPMTPDLAKYRRMSKSALCSYREEMNRQLKEEEPSAQENSENDRK